MPFADYDCLSFNRWTHWDSRLRLSKDVDVPVDFGIHGVYLIAKFDQAPEDRKFHPNELPKEIIYIGKSSHVDSRLEKSHPVIKRYKEQSGVFNALVYHGGVSMEQY